MIITGLVSCQRDSLLEEESTGGNYPKHIISVLPHAENEVDLTSRGTPIVNEQQMTDIGVFCAATGSSDWTASAAPGKMFNTRLARHSDSGKWEYIDSPISWAPGTGNDRYSFFAYAPYATAQNGITVQGSSATTGIPSITYTLPTDVTAQPDLMLAVPRYNLRPATSTVGLQMKHALTCVGFQIKGNGEQIKSVSLSGIYTSGTAKLSGDAIVWSNLTLPGTAIDYTALINFDAGKNYFTAQPTLSTNLIAGNGYLMMIPQTLPGNAKLKLTFSDNTTREISLNTQTWGAGKKIIYNIIVTPTGIITLSPSAFYIPSLGVTQLTDNLQLSCEPSNMQWTLSSNALWLRLTTHSDGSNASTTISGQGAATIYTIADANFEFGERFATLYVNGNASSIVGTITQLRKIDLTALPHGGTHPFIVPTYVGAFWRASQVGERIIRIPVGVSTDNLGTWTASVEWIDSNWKLGDICISPLSSLDTGISYSRDLTPGDAEGFKVTDKLTATAGSVISNGSIYFRIGLTSTYTPTATSPARYALIALAFNNRAKTQLILLRQGEGADYVMRPQDPAVGTYVNPTRPLARKIMVYNITQPASNWVGGSQIGDHPDLPFRGGSLTEYPTQAGAYFQWAAIDLTRRAFHPVNPLAAITGWSNNSPYQYWTEGGGAPKLSTIIEVCPPGYKRINDGAENVAINETAAASELRQSLLETLANGTTTILPMNVSSGYYADGFFDRRQIKSSSAGYAGTVVSYYPGTSNPLNAQVAYIGTLIYNPTTWASTFFPATGSRNPLDGSLLDTGRNGYYWTSSGKDYRAYATGFWSGNTTLIYGINFERPTGGSIRCVAIP